MGDGALIPAAHFDEQRFGTAFIFKQISLLLRKLSGIESVIQKSVKYLSNTILKSGMKKQKQKTKHEYHFRINLKITAKLDTHRQIRNMRIQRSFRTESNI